MSLIINFKDVKLRFGNFEVFTGISFSVLEKERIAVVGKNGSGKSTLLKIIAGLQEIDSGEVTRKLKSRVSYLPQEPMFGSYKTPFEYMKSKLPSEKEESYHLIISSLQEIGLEPEVEISKLSGGEKRKVDIMATLLTDAEVLVMDEPTNHLDIEYILWLENKIKNYKGTVLTISHDRKFLESISTSCIWIDRGEVKKLNKNYQFFEEWAGNILEQEYMSLQKLNKLIASETEWARGGISARRKRNQGRLRKLQELRQESSDYIKLPDSMKLKIEQTEDIKSKMILRVKNLSKAFDNKIIVKNFDLRIIKGERIGIVGPNGIGKSTLVKLFLGELQPNSGTVWRAENHPITYLDQYRSVLDPNKTLWEATVDDNKSDSLLVQGHLRHVVSYLKDFLFSENQIKGPVAMLSGGEKNRLLLAKTLAKTTDVLVMDEPTNDLDLDSLEILENTINDFEGTLIVISHDRDFLDRVVTSIIAYEGNGQWQTYAGGYSDYLSQKKLNQKEENLSNQKKDKQINNSQKNKDNQSETGINKNKKKLSYTQQHQLRELPQKIEIQEKLIKDIEQKLDTPNLASNNFDMFNDLINKLEKERQQLVEMENLWLELEALAEENN